MRKTSVEASCFRILVVVLAGLLILGNFGRIILSDKVAIYLHDVLFILVAGWTLLHARQSWVFLIKHAWFKPFSIFVGITALSLVIAAITGQGNIAIGLSYFARFCVYFTLFPFLGLGLKKKYILRKDILVLLVIVAGGVAILGLLQYIFLPDVRFLRYLGYDDHYYRLISTYFDPPFTAAVLIAGIFLLMGESLKIKKLWLIWVTLFIALLLTYSRAAYISLFAGIITLFLQTRRVKGLILIGVLAIGIVLLPRPASEGARLERVQSIFSRVNVFEEGIRGLDAKTLLIGQGWYMTNTTRKAPTGVLQSHSSAPDNSYLLVLQSSGIAGLFAFLWFLSELLKTFSKDRRVLPILVALLVGSLANNLLFYPMLMILLWMMLNLYRQDSPAVS